MFGWEKQKEFQKSLVNFIYFVAMRRNCARKWGDKTMIMGQLDQKRYFFWRRKSAEPKPEPILENFASEKKAPLDGLQFVEKAVAERRSCKIFDPSRPVDEALLKRLLESTCRAPTGFNLQPWTSIVVTDAAIREKLAVAALGQTQVSTAPVTIVFAGDMDPSHLAPAALEIGLQSGYYRPAYGPQYLRMVYYMLHGGPQQAMALAKSLISHWYSANTKTPLLSVPLSREAYAWKQTMIPLTTFVLLATSAGLDTCIMEGVDAEMVKQVVGLPERYSVPCVVSVGYAAKQEGAFHSVRSPRFSTGQLVRWNKF